MQKQVGKKVKIGVVQMLAKDNVEDNFAFCKAQIEKGA